MISMLIKKVEINEETKNVVSRANIVLVTNAIQPNARCCTDPVF